MTQINLPNHLINPDPTIYESFNYVTLDFETTNLQKGTAHNPENSIVLSVWSKSNDNGRTRRDYTSSWGSEYELGSLVSDIENARFVVAHNAKFELLWLQRCGLDIENVVVFDTQIAEKVLAGNKSTPVNLDDTAERWKLGNKSKLVSRLIKSGICPSTIPKNWLLKYCHQDVALTEELFKRQYKELKSLGLLHIFFTRCLLTPVLAEQECNGMHLDRDKVIEEYEANVEELEQVNKEMDELTGGINPRSPSQVAEFLYERLGFEEPRRRDGAPARTPAGNRKTDAATIENLKATTQAQKRFVQLKKKENKLSARISKNLEFFYGVVTEQEGVFRAEFNQTVTATHRLSSSGIKTKFEAFPKEKSVQFQNLPREYKSLFSSRFPGWFMGEVDGAQLEFRVAASAGNDEQAEKDIANEEDIHKFSASVLFGTPVTKAKRQDAKAHTFKPLYGGQSGTTRQKKYYNEFRKKYKGIYETQLGWVHEVLKTGKLRLPWGMIFYWPDTKMMPDGYITNTSNIFNYPIQSLATAEIIPIAHVYLHHMMKAHGMHSFLVNTVHDSSIAEIHPDERELFQILAVKAYTDIVYWYLREVYNYDFKVPLGAEVQIGPFWSTGEEVKTNKTPELLPKEVLFEKVTTEVENYGNV